MRTGPIFLFPIHPDDHIFDEALALPPPARAAFLDRACAGDAAQRARLEELLASYEAAEHFLEDSPAARLGIAPETKPGDVIGRYTLLRKLGDGGCGVVYLAEQSEPLRRRVALKVIKLGMDTASVIARFEAERQTLALMDHPDIARVYDAGATENGRPYFVMEYVDGVPITRFADEHSLSMAARLELFARVCVALQHAHQKGIIHRDLKPSNILVTLQDGVPAPKVIDFGIAKATQGRLAEELLLTGPEQFIGTPAYMSPEQAERRDLDIDTRSDVYSLGVLLYELVTGRPPFDPKSLQQAGLNEIRRIIREVDPPRPSTRIATLTRADSATAARLRGSAPPQLTSLLRGDLDWIVMRCLEKNRDRRYDTAQELAADVRRHLRREPVVARPPSVPYRTRRFIARHRLACFSVVSIALALVAGTAISLTQAVRARRAEQVAQAARADAQRRQEQAEDLLTFMLGDFRTELQKAGRINLLNPVGVKAEAYFASLDPRDATDTALARHAKALYQIGEVRRQEAKYTEAAEAFAESYRRAAALAARHPGDAGMLFERAQAEYWIGAVARSRGDSQTLRTWWGRYRDSAIALVAIEGKTPRAQLEIIYSQHNLATVEAESGNFAQALTGFQAEKVALDEQLALKPADVELRRQMADLVTWLGIIAERDGNYLAALERFTEMVSRYEELAKAEPATARWRKEVATSVTFTGNVHALLGHRAEAAAAYERARALFDELVAQDPKNRQREMDGLNVRLLRAGLLLAEADVDVVAAEAVVADLRKRLETLVALEPTAQAFRRLLAKACRLDGRLRLAASRPDAGEAVTRSLELGQALVNEARADGWTVAEFAQASLLAGRIAAAASETEQARGHWTRALAAISPRLERSNDWRLLDPAAQALVLLGRTEEARPLVARLQRLGYQPIDPLAAAILAPAPPATSEKIPP